MSTHCKDVNDFHEKLQLALINQREATCPGGYYGTILGDQRKDGKYHSFQAEAICRMPADELKGVIIKAQHNVQSSRTSYGAMKLPMLTHEYIILWAKRESKLFGFLKTVAIEAQARLTGTWKNVVRQCLIQCGGTSNLATLYSVVEKSCDHVKSNEHWRDKVRQILNQHPDLFASQQRGVWSLA